ncbi:hypothetical protein A3F06_02690 [candidate division TM6 bacterium RIFCSPHIGHO2_12_FULL_36_22]|nr:MAG: hypothetical protein A3F06_02690 [candidate division TM6 bacterium RIFCSPHIGHO2_12_FULL_36_22]
MKKLLLIGIFSTSLGLIYAQNENAIELKKEEFFDFPEEINVEEENGKEEFFDFPDDNDKEEDTTEKVILQETPSEGPKINRTARILYLASIFGPPFIYSLYINALPYILPKEQYEIIQFSMDPFNPDPDFITILGTEAAKKFWEFFNKKYLSQLYADNT